ncbi:unnamed protein product [Ectocarpus sp. CCAP 1310/34]|nr:unnamed protein product [Ectocarpus sp. CCAP 1310/34]
MFFFSFVSSLFSLPSSAACASSPFACNCRRVLRIGIGVSMDLFFSIHPCTFFQLTLFFILTGAGSL